MNVLKLTLKKKWFDMILAGEKPEEYREIKPYWITRLIDMSDYPAEEKDDFKTIAPNIAHDIKQGHDPIDVLKSYFCKLKTFDAIEFTNGYSKTSPSFVIECKGINIGYGDPAWGAPSYRDALAEEVVETTFILKLGKIIAVAR